MLNSGPLDPYHENVMSSTQAEVLNVSQRRQRRTEPRLQVTCTQNLVKIGRVVFELRERTDKHTDILIAILRTPPGGVVMRSDEMR